MPGPVRAVGIVTEPEYFAVPDPSTGDMTYWRTHRGDITEWPPKVRYGPLLYKRDVPANLRGDERTRWARNWFATVRAPWDAAIVEAITSDPTTAAARFAAFNTRCCCCGRALTDPASKAYGIGPDCRGGLPGELLAELARQVGRAHAELLAAGGAG